MLRAAIRQTTTSVSRRARTPLATRSWARYQSTVPGASEVAGPSTSSAVNAAKAERQPSDPQTMLKMDAEVDDALNKALLEALEKVESELEVEGDAAPLTIQGYQEEIFETIAPTNPKYNDPTVLPLTQPLSQDYSSVSEEEWHASLVRGRSVQPAHQHTPIYHIPAASLHLRSHHPKLLDFFAHFASHAAASLGIPISRVAHLPTQRSLWTVPRGPFVHKKSQENFERRTHKRAIKAWDAHPEVVDRWMQYLRKHALAGVGMRVTRWHRLPLGSPASDAGMPEQQQGKTHQRLPVEKIKVLADKIIKDESAQATAAAAPSPVAAPN